MKKRIFLTGAAGFIGFHLAQRLKSTGDEILGYDNYNDYYDPSLKKARSEILKSEGISIIEGDICDLNQLQQSITKFKPTHIVHLAAQAGVRYSLQNPHTYVKQISKDS